MWVNGNLAHLVQCRFLTLLQEKDTSKKISLLLHLFKIYTAEVASMNEKKEDASNIRIGSYECRKKCN